MTASLPERGMPNFTPLWWIRHIRWALGNEETARHLGITEEELLEICARGKSLDQELEPGFRQLMKAYQQLVNEAADLT